MYIIRIERNVLMREAYIYSAGLVIRYPNGEEKRILTVASRAEEAQPSQQIQCLAGFITGAPERAGERSTQGQLSWIISAPDCREPFLIVERRESALV